METVNINGIAILIEKWFSFMPFMELGEPLHGNGCGLPYQCRKTRHEVCILPVQKKRG